MLHEAFLRQFTAELASIDTDSLVKDAGITEFCFLQNLSAGISYETVDEPDMTEGFIFNLFYDDEYVNVSGIYQKTADGFTDLYSGCPVTDAVAEAVSELP